MRRFKLGALVMVAVLSASCAGQSGGEVVTAQPGRNPTPTTQTSPTAQGKPKPEPKREGEAHLPAAPPITVSTADGDRLELKPWTYCWQSGCVDGWAPEEPPAIAGAAEVLVEFPKQDWEFVATFRTPGDRCSRHVTVPLVRKGTGWVITPMGLAGTYDVDVFGSGGGDAVATFRWTTPVDGPIPPPTATLSVVADNDGQTTSYGVELSADMLARTPKKASASIVVTSAEGRSTTVKPARADEGGCAFEGTLWMKAAESTGHQAAALGSPPFRYDVTLVLDGVTHRATATWPKDQRARDCPSSGSPLQASTSTLHRLSVRVSAAIRAYVPLRTSL